jgi:hypothetical protein
MHAKYPELHACLCFLALSHKDKLTYLEPRFRRQEFEWSDGRVETDDSLRVVLLIAAEECQRRFQKEAADEALGGMFAITQLMSISDASVAWAAPARWNEEDRGSLGCLDIWDGLRQLSLVALRDLEWPVERPRLSCLELLHAASGGRFFR